MRLQPLVGGDFHIRSDPQAACVASRAHSGQGVIGAHVLVRIDDAGVLADEQGAVIAETVGECARVPGVHLQVFGGHMIRIGDHRRFGLTHDDFAVVCPTFSGHLGGRQRFELARNLHDRGFGQRAVGGDQADTGAYVMLSLAEEIGGDQFWVARTVGHDEDFRWTGQLIDTHGAEHLALGFINEGVSRAHDLIDPRDGLRAERHRGDRLGPADPENAVGAGQVASGDHRRVGVGRQAGHDLVASGDFAGHDCHDRRRQQGETPARNISPDPFDRDYPVAQMQARQRFDIQRHDGRQLRLGEPPHVFYGELGILAGLPCHSGHGGLPVGGRNFKRV